VPDLCRGSSTPRSGTGNGQRDQRPGMRDHDPTAPAPQRPRTEGSGVMDTNTEGADHPVPDAEDETEHAQADEGDSPTLAGLRERVREDCARRHQYGQLGKLL
jgi:hypothetical protein